MPIPLRRYIGTGIIALLALVGARRQDLAQERPPLTPEERRKVMDKMIEQMQRNVAGQGIRVQGEPTATPQGVTPAPAPAPTGPPIPSVVQRAPIAIPPHTSPR